MEYKPKLLYVNHRFLPRSAGGTQLHTLWLAHELAEMYEIFVFTQTQDPSLADYAIRDYEFQGLKVRSVKVPNKFWIEPYNHYLNPRVEELFSEYMDEVQPALVHLHHTARLSASIVELVAARGVPLVLQLRDFYYMCHRGILLDASRHLCDGPGDGTKCADCIKSDSTRRLPRGNDLLHSQAYERAGNDRAEYMRQLLLLPDIIICPSDFVKEKFLEFNVPAEKIKVSPTGIKIFEKNINQKPLPQGRRIIVFGVLGNPWYFKGIDTIIEAFSRLDQTKAELRIYGEESGLTEEPRDHARDLNVRFLGRYSHEQLPEILSEIDVIIQASICHESYSLVIREAFAASIPVIVSDIRAQMDAVRNGDNGLHFHAGDPTDLSMKMDLLIRNPEMISEFSQRVPKVRSIADQAAEFATIYQRLLDAKTNPSELTLTRLSALRELRERIKSHDIELQAIRCSPSYELMRFLLSKTDRMFPDGTRRGAFRRKAIGVLLDMS